jgi:hypothetical protein
MMERRMMMEMKKNLMALETLLQRKCRIQLAPKVIRGEEKKMDKTMALKRKLQFAIISRREGAVMGSQGSKVLMGLRSALSDTPGFVAGCCVMVIGAEVAAEDLKMDAKSSMMSKCVSSR